MAHIDWLDSQLVKRDGTTFVKYTFALRLGSIRLTQILRAEVNYMLIMRNGFKYRKEVLRTISGIKE